MIKVIDKITNAEEFTEGGESFSIIAQVPIVGNEKYINKWLKEIKK